MRTKTADQLVRVPAMLYGLVLLSVAIAGFAGAPTILGVFETTTFHNLIHIFLGVLLVLSSIYSTKSTRLVGAFLAALYLFLAICSLLHVSTENPFFRALIETTTLSTSLRAIFGVAIMALLWCTSRSRSYIRD